MIKVRSFKFLLEYQYLYYILHRSSFKSPTLAGNGASGGKGQQESNGVNNTNGGPTQVLVLISSHWMDQIVISVHISSSCNILFQGVRNVPQSILYALYWFIYSLCVYVQQCLGEESVLNFKNFCQQLLIMKLVQNKPTKPNDNVSSCYFQLSIL